MRLNPCSRASAVFGQLRRERPLAGATPRLCAGAGGADVSDEALSDLARTWIGEWGAEFTESSVLREELL